MNLLNKYTSKELILLVSSFLMSFMLVLRDQIIPPFILIFFLATIPFWKGERQHKEKLLPILLVAFYAIHLLSMLYSEDWTYGGSDLMTKLSYVLFPLFYFVLRGGQQIVYKGVIWGLIIGSGISMVYSFARAVILERGFSGETFQSNHYGLNMHASYLAMLLILSGVFLWTIRTRSVYAIILKLVYTVLITISVFYLRSLGAFVCIAIILGVVPLWKAILEKKKKWLLLLPLYALIFLLGVKASPKISNDVNTSLTKLTTWFHSPEQFLLNNKNDTESNTVRLVVWTLSSRIIAHHPFGVGIGDVKAVLEKYYRSYGYTYYVHYKLNPHNQFLQTGIAIGWIGILLLLFIFIRMMLVSIRVNDLALFVAALCIFLSCLFESMLERQVGVIFFAIMILLIALRSSDNVSKQFWINHNSTI